MSECSECGGRCELGMTDTYLTNNGVLHAITECVKNLKSQLAQAREEIATIKHDLRLTQDEHIEAMEERDNLKKAVNMQTDLYRAQLVKNEKLERVRVAAEDLASNAFAECSTKTAPRIDYFVDAEKLDKLKIILAALRETEGK